MSEHIKALFAGQDLSEEFKEKAAVIFAAALDEQAKQVTDTVTASLQEEFDTRIAARITELEGLAESYIKDQVQPQVDKYLTAAVTEWAQENKVAMVAGAKVELAESFLTGLVGLAESHNLNMPQGTVDQVGELETQLGSLKESLNALTDKNIDLMNENSKFKSTVIVSKITESLSETQKESFASVVEKVEYKSDEQFTAAVKSLYESYFPVGQVAQIIEPVEPQKPVVAEQTSYESHLFNSLRG
jgi:regulator of replication initiation timing